MMNPEQMAEWGALERVTWRKVLLEAERLGQLERIAYAEWMIGEVLTTKAGKERA